MRNRKRKPPPELVEEARRNPSGWVYEIDGQYATIEEVPPHAIRGGWEVLADGTLSGEYKPNPNYRSRRKAARRRA